MKILVSIAVFAFASLLSLTPVHADEMDMHAPEPQGAQAKDMGMTDTQHKAIEMKAHQKYDVAVKMAEKEYALAIKKAAKTKNSPAAIKTAKVKLRKAKAAADATYKKEKNAAMKKVVVPVIKKPTAPVIK